MFDSAIWIPLRTMIETSLSADAYRGNEGEESTRVKYEAKSQVRGCRVGSIDGIAVCVDKKIVSERTYQLERGGSGRSHGSDRGRQRLTCGQTIRLGAQGLRVSTAADCSFDQTEGARP